MLLQATGVSGGAATAPNGQNSGRPPENVESGTSSIATALPVLNTPGWTTHATREGRLYYCNHLTRVAGWLPPLEEWGVGEEETLPYGWEQAVDAHGTPYYINHVNKTTTYEAPALESRDDIASSSEERTAPEPRNITLNRSPTLGFGFVAGSERPVVVRFVTEDGPSQDKLLPGDEILSVNGEDVALAPRERVIAAVRASTNSVQLVVCQPRSRNSTCARKSTLLSAGKRARLRARPPRVRFADSVCVNGAPLFPPSAFSLGEMCAPPMANVLKVFLENGQTKSFKYDANTTVHDVVSSLQSKLCLSAIEHFSLVVEHVKSLRRNKLTLLDPQDTLARIASRPGAHKLRCLFRVSFVPVSAGALAQKDPATLDYLFSQCCNDVTAERFSPELQPDIALRLAALHMHQHALSNNVPPSKLTVKSVEREFGLERFVPPSLLDSMKKKEVRRLVSHFLRSYSSIGNGVPGSNNGGTKILTPLQAKLLYLDLVSQLPSYGAKCFSAGPPRIATPTDCLERVLLVSPRFGLSQIAGPNSVPVPIARLEDMWEIRVKRQDEINCAVDISLTSDRSLRVSMDERDACELALVLQGYHRVLTGKILPVDREREPPAEDLAPPYLAQHNVVPAKWSYLDYESLPLQRAMFMCPPKYHIGENGVSTVNGYYNSDTIKRANAVNHIKPLNGTLHVDNNMNSSMSNKNQVKVNKKYDPDVNTLSYDIQSVVSMEILENGIIETKNDDVLKRVQEMQKLVESSEQYLTEQEKINKDDQDVHLDVESDSDSQISGFDDTPGPLKHSDSLILLMQNQKHETAMNGHVDLSALDIIRADLMQSESDTDSLCTPTNSPIRYANNKSVRTSFGLHSPDNNCKNEQDLKEYLRKLREHAHMNNIDYESDLHNLETNLNIYELDPDIIDLTLLPPPQTPDELDDLSNISSALNIPPSSFADTPTTFSKSLFRDSNRFDKLSTDQFDKLTQNELTGTDNDFNNINKKNNMYINDPVNLDDVDFDTFLASVTVQPPTQQITPAIELTPEEIMSYIIPPPPDVMNDFNTNSTSSSSSLSSNSTTQKQEPINILNVYDLKRRNSGSDIRTNTILTNSNHIIDYSTVDRKGTFSCCGKSKSDKQNQYKKSECEDTDKIQPPPRNNIEIKPPERPPKSTMKNNNGISNRQRSNSLSNDTAPSLPPRENMYSHNVPPHIFLPPKKPPLPPVPSVELRCKRIPMPNLKNRTAGIGSPHLQRNKNEYKDLDNGVNSLEEKNNLFTYDKNVNNEPKKAISTPTSPHLMRNAKLSVPLVSIDQITKSITDSKEPSVNNKTANSISNNSSTDHTSVKRNNILLRKNSLEHERINTITEHRRTVSSVEYSHHSGLRLTEHSVPELKQSITDMSGLNRSHSESRGQCSTKLRENLLAKSDVALAGLLVRLDQVAAQCSAAQAHGGGRQMSEEKFQIARDELTSQSLQLVTCSKCVVVAMSNVISTDLPEHLASCLTILRRLTELSQDLTAHTTAPLQTRNLILKVHSVTAAFRELISATIEHNSTEQLEEQLAKHAECLANVLATLLRSLRVFSP